MSVNDQTAPGQQKSPHYALIIDQKRNDILASLYQSVATNSSAKITFNILIRQAGLTHEEVDGFVNEWGDKEHALGWCRDPLCDWENEKHEHDGN